MGLLAGVARVLAAPFVRFDIRGGACCRDLHVGIIAVNHRSLFDVVAGLIALDHFGRYPRLLVAEKYVRSAWTAPFARAIGAIAVPRGGGDAVVAAGVAALCEGIPLLVMPEGRLHRDAADPTTTGPAHRGVSRLAVGASTIVVTASLRGTDRVWPATAPLPRLNPFRRKVVVVRVADEPLRLVGDDHQANADAVMADIRRMLAADLDVDVDVDLADPTPSVPRPRVEVAG